MGITKRTWKIIKCVFLVLYIILTFVIEVLYRESLFEKSLKIEKNYFDNQSTPTQIKFFKFITNFGTQGVLIPLLLLVFFLFPLNKSYTFLSVVVLASYFDNVLKIIYGSPRPFWKDKEIFRVCDGGYGNPSGHSFSSFSVYLSFWNIMTSYDFFTKTASGILIKLLLFVILVGLSVVIVISRICLSVHAINQIIFGGFLGFALYFYFFHVIELDRYSGRKFAEYITEIRFFIFHSAKFVIYFIVMLILYLYRSNDESTYEDVISELCPHLRSYRKYNNDAFFIGLVLFYLIGAHYGLYFLFQISKIQYPDRENQINNWYKGNFCQLLYKLLLFIPFNFCFVMFLFVRHDECLWRHFLFGVIIPYFFTGGLMFGPFILSSIKCRITNEDLYRFDLPVTTDGDITVSEKERNVEIEISIKHNNK